MAITSCSRCGEQLQLRIAANESLEKLKQLELDSNVLCLGCFRAIQEYDVVKIIIGITDQPDIEVGDTGVILLVFNDGEAFEVECVLENGQNKWQATLIQSQIKWIQTPA
jgi:hypothetical protein